MRTSLVVLFSLASAAALATPRASQPLLRQASLTSSKEPQQHSSKQKLLLLRGGDKHSLSLKGASPMVKTCAFFASLDALLLGYDIGVVSGILVFIQDQFKLSLLETGNFAAALNAAAIVGALVSGYIADKFGRKPALFVSSLMFTTGSFLMAAANDYKSLLIGRYVQGYGVGAGLLISPMFISEIAPPAFRGSLVTLSEVSLSFGVLLAYVVNVALSGLPNQWRWMLALGAVPGVLLTLRILFLPESPRFLVAQGKEDEAKDVLKLITAPEPESAALATLADIKARAAPLSRRIYMSAHPDATRCSLPAWRSVLLFLLLCSRASHRSSYCSPFIALLSLPFPHRSFHCSLHSADAAECRGWLLLEAPPAQGHPLCRACRRGARRAAACCRH